MPTGVVPNQHPHLVPALPPLPTGPVQKGRGERTHRAPRYEAQEHFVLPVAPQPITGQRLRVGVPRRRRLALQARRVLLITPQLHVGHGKAAPPDLIHIADPPVVLVREFDQPVAAAFFWAYAGSGEVIQCLGLTIYAIILWQALAQLRLGPRPPRRRTADLMHPAKSPAA